MSEHDETPVACAADLFQELDDLEGLFHETHVPLHVPATNRDVRVGTLLHTRQDCETLEEGVTRIEQCIHSAIERATHRGIESHWGMADCIIDPDDASVIRHEMDRVRSYLLKRHNFHQIWQRTDEEMRRN